MEAKEIEELEARLRAEPPFFSCPTKADRIFLTEDQWRAVRWTEEERFRNAALPHKLWNMRHDDRPWPLCRQWRGGDALGPLAGEGHPKYLPAPPRLVEGRGIARWITLGDESVAEVPELASFKKTWTEESLPEIIEFYERKPGTPNFGQYLRFRKKNFLRLYSPTSIQKFSDRSWLVRSPRHVSWHRMIRRREIVGRTQDETGCDVVLFYRRGCRFDQLDKYYVSGAFYFGLRWN